MTRRLPSSRRDRITVAAGLYALALGALLLPALVNAFPLVMGDTWRYVREADGLYSWASSHFYGYLLRLLSGSSLWLVVLLQAAVALAVVGAFFRRVLDGSHAAAAAGAALVALTSSLALFTSLVMTDVWLGLGVVAAATLLLAPDRRWADVGLALVVAYATAVHPVALPLLALLTFASAVAAAAARMRTGRWTRLAGAGVVAGGVAAGAAALTVSNAIIWGKPSPNPHSSVATFAYLYYHGDLDRQLEECERWDVCTLPRTAPRWPERRTLFQFAGRDLSEFNWFLFDAENSILWREYGGPTEFAGRARAIVVDHVGTDPLGYARRVGSTGWDQLFQVRALDHLDWMTRYLGARHSALLVTHHDGDLSRFERGRQFREALDLGWTGFLTAGFALAGAAAAVAAGGASAARALSRRPRLPPPLGRAVAASLLFLACYVAHALVVGTSTYPTPRYGGRVSWLLVLGLWGLAYALLRLRRARVEEDDVAEPSRGDAQVAHARGRPDGAGERR